MKERANLDLLLKVWKIMGIIKSVLFPLAKEEFAFFAAAQRRAGFESGFAPVRAIHAGKTVCTAPSGGSRI